jgi:hypothetical protein
MKLAIMQPYIFPYIGYYQLVGAVDKFIFYDDVNFIKRGWINRTNILSKEGKQMLSISLIKSSQNKLINEIELAGDHHKLLKTIQHTYSKAPFFKDAFPIVESCLNGSYKYISELAAESIRVVNDYLELKTEFELSSDFHRSTAGYEKARRLIDICRKENADDYINSIGGQAIYTKEEFANQGINLYFLKSTVDEYDQSPIRKETFEPNLSIIDVMMFNEKNKIKEMILNYELI